MTHYTLTMDPWIALIGFAVILGLICLLSWKGPLL